MKKQNERRKLISDWFKNIFIVFGFIFLIEFISNCYASYVPYIILSYPIILLWILQYEKSPEENGKSGKGIYFFNISLCIIALFTIILLVNYKYYIEHAGKFFIGGNTFLITDNYNLKIALYIFGILYFVFASIYLSNRIKFWIESYEGIGDFQIGKKIWNDINLPIHKGQNLGALRNTEFVKSQIKEALKFFDKAIEKGVVESELYSLRGNCLNDLEYYIDALDDYDKAIEGNPKHGIASNYHMRSMIKDTIFDYKRYRRSYSSLKIRQ